MAQDLPDSVKQNAAAQAASNGDNFDALLSKIAVDGVYIPWEDVVLPSKGAYYDNKIPDGIIKVRPMSIDVDKLMSNQRILASGTLLAEIVNACVKFPDPTFTVYDMLAGDQFFLLYYLRGITHGPDYEFVNDCPFCGTKGTFEYNLGNLQNTIKGPNLNYPEEPMAIVLPKLTEASGTEVKALVRLIRVRDVVKMANADHIATHDPLRKSTARNQNVSIVKTPVATTNPEKTYLDNIKLQIVGFEISGKRFTDERKNKLIERLHQTDSTVIKDFIDNVTPGIDTVVTMTCQNKECSKEFSASLPFGVGFFRPTK